MTIDLVLVNPPVRLNDVPRNFPQGLGSLAAFARSEGYDVYVIDANAERLTVGRALTALSDLSNNWGPIKTVGVGGLITTWNWSKDFLKRLWRSGLCQKQLVGGSLAGGSLDLARAYLKADEHCPGEGEYWLSDVLQNRSNTGTLADLDSLPYPAWDLFPMEIYLAHPVVNIGQDMDVITSRGCPYGCKYCYHHFGRKWRGRSAEHVVGELVELRERWSVECISFQDDCFVVDAGRVADICGGIDANVPGLKWSCTGRVGLVTPELLGRMKASGCVSVSYGLESGSEEMLKAMHKAQTLEQMAQAVEWTRQAGLRCPVSFMIGYPGETPMTVAETAKFCCDNYIRLQDLMFVTPYPGTELWTSCGMAGWGLARQEKLVSRMGDAVDLCVNLTDMSDLILQGRKHWALTECHKHYQENQSKYPHLTDEELYGKNLVEKAHVDAKMAEHRSKHGFNE